MYVICGLCVHTGQPAAHFSVPHAIQINILFYKVILYLYFLNGQLILTYYFNYPDRPSMWL
jgi:hypothetical protein